MAIRGDIFDRVQALESRVRELERQKDQLRGETATRWPAAGNTTETIAPGTFGEVQLVNQYTASDAGKVRAKNPYAVEIPSSTFVTVHQVNGIVVIFTADCPA